MRVLVIGPKRVANAQEVIEAAHQESGFPITEIVTGNLTDLDDELLKYCSKNKHHLRLCFASKMCFGSDAIQRRNEHQIESSDALIALFDGQDDTTLKMVEAANKKNLKVYVKFVPTVFLTETSVGV